MGETCSVVIQESILELLNLSDFFYWVFVFYLFIFCEVLRLTKETNIIIKDFCIESSTVDF